MVETPYAPDDEIWKVIPGFETYEVSDYGRVRNARTKQVRKQQVHPRGGYRQIHLYHPVKPRSYAKVHRLVLEAFVGPCPTGMVACHANDVADDNRLINLRWDTPQGNELDKRHNNGNPNSRKTHCPQGHAYTPENTKILTSGSRRCRICMRAQAKGWMTRNREQWLAYRREWRRQQKERAA